MLHLLGMVVQPTAVGGVLCTENYSFSHNHGHGKLMKIVAVLKGNDPIGDTTRFFTFSMITGGRVLGGSSQLVSG